MTNQTESALGFDFGLRRIGIAFGQSLTATAQPLDPICANDGTPDWTQIDRIVSEWQPNLMVIGLPLNMDGSISEMARRARKFANRLNERYRTPCFLYDERLTSFEAKSQHLNAGGKADFGKESVDGVAAQLMLEGWFAQDQRIPSHARLEDYYGQ